ncbi:MAG: BamA/TamA family outer membrane protein [Bacteroidia bacterium]
MKLTQLLVFVCIFSYTAIASKTDSNFSKKSLLVLPIAYYTPETNWAFGIGGIGYYNFGKNRSETRPSSAYFYASYTLNNQLVVDLPFHIFSNKEKWYAAGEIAVYDFPFNYYGVGCGIDPNNSESYELQQQKFNLTIYRKAKSNWYAGPRFFLDRLSEIDYNEHGRISMLNINGIDGGISTGIGASILYDSRKNVYCPKKGWFLDIGYLNYAKGAFNITGFHNIRADIRHYTQISKTTVLATNFFGNFNIGEVPFYMLSEFGGLFRMRGYYRGAYRDKNVMLLQTEIRQDIIGRFGITFFGGFATVFSDLEALKTNPLKPSGGIGIRFKINRKEDIPIRADFGFGKGFHGNYITTGEAY